MASTAYKRVQEKSEHGDVFVIGDDDEEDELDEEFESTDGIQLSQNGDSSHGLTARRRAKRKDTQEASDKLTLSSIWTTMTFSWMGDLLRVGNQKPLEMEDLLDLHATDKSQAVYKRFKQAWTQQVNEAIKPSLSLAFVSAFGMPFLAAGIIKFIHDSSLFIGPQLLNQLILFLSDPSQPTSWGLTLVACLFCSSFIQSLCLRQYFWWCYRTGMNLRSAVVTSVYNKSMVVSAAAMTRKTTGEITNLMAVDSSRLQELTPFLHALWYSFYQIVVALYFLWQQMGIACLAGVTVIIIMIPISSRVSRYMKTLQKQISKIRDDRVKLSNEVLAGMKVIKLQAWEREFQQRLDEVRNEELSVFRRYSIAQCGSVALYTAIPLLVSITTFATYIALGNELDVATALTSLALFELLRFPLFMFPIVVNNVVEAIVSVERVRSFLLERERIPVGIYPLRTTGILMQNAALVWEGTLTRKMLHQNSTLDSENNEFSSTKKSNFEHLMNYMKRKFSNVFGMFRSNVSSSSAIREGQLSRLPSFGDLSPVTPGKKNDDKNDGKTKENAKKNEGKAKEKVKENFELTEAEIEVIIKEALLHESMDRIKELELQLKNKQMLLTSPMNMSTMIADYTGEEEFESSTSPLLTASSSFVHEATVGTSTANMITDDSETTSFHNSKDNKDKQQQQQQQQRKHENRILTLSQIRLHATTSQMIGIVGQVGSGKSSLLQSLLGYLRQCHGTVALRGSVAYTAQLPFIANSTLRDNILYGRSYHAEKYQDTLTMCALLPDLAVLPAGDMTEIGERGINLSGGQKSRVSLARAIYSDADIYLLDDPLSAVDAHVGQHLFYQCILPLAQTRQKCVIFVTNALAFTRFCSSILVMSDGHVVESGTFASLQAQNATFAEMLRVSAETGSTAQKSILEEEKSVEIVGASLLEVGEVKVDDADPKSTKKKSTSDVLVHESKETETARDKASKDVEKPKASDGSLMTKEDREVGDVSLAVYLKWATAAGGLYVGIFIILFFIGGETTSVISSWWLSYWSEHGRSTDVNGKKQKSFFASAWFYLSIYCLFNLLVVIASFGREFYVRLKSLKASKQLWQELLTAVLYAPMSFYDTTPLGRIVNRFSKDLYTVDEQLPSTIRGYLTTNLRVLITLLYISGVTPLFLVGIVPLGYLYSLAQRYYIKTSRELSRLESTARSPIYALFSETLDGLATIRAYDACHRLVKKMNTLLDNNQKAYYLNYSANCWLAVRLEFVGTIIVTLTAFFAVMARMWQSTSSAPTQTATYAGLAGLAISMAMSITQSLNWTVRMASDLESQMVSVERIKTYSVMEQEKAHFIDTDPATIHTTKSKVYSDGDKDKERRDQYSQRLANALIQDQLQDGGIELTAATRSPLFSSQQGVWPSQGQISFDSVVLRYRPGLPTVLNNLTFDIPAGAKVGIVGRTGAGKSSIVVSLLRLVELESGRVSIDGVDVSKLGLHTLRSCIAVIPQDPVLFSGTVRSNLDPFGRYTDIELRSVLDRALLGPSVISTLDMVVSEAGNNFSVGQRQLLCIARALLMQAKVIVMDEATAAVDVETDSLIQQTMRVEFASATCLVIAHRLNTILDSDLIMVMDAGKVAELAPPRELIANEQSLFAALVRNWDDSH